MIHILYIFACSVENAPSHGLRFDTHVLAYVYRVGIHVLSFSRVPTLKALCEKPKDVIAEKLCMIHKIK